MSGCTVSYWLLKIWTDGRIKIISGVIHFLRPKHHHHKFLGHDPKNKTVPVSAGRQGITYDNELPNKIRLDKILKNIYPLHHDYNY